MRGAYLGRYGGCLFGAASLLACIVPVTAADATDPQRVEERLPAEQARPDAAPPPVHIDDEDLAAIPEFELKSVVVEGMRAIDPRAADVCKAEVTGQKIGAADLVGLTSCITALYRDGDYFLSRAIIPPQEVEGGVLKVRVIEGSIVAIEPSGLDQADADAQFAAALSETPLRLATFERCLLLLADRYGRRVSSTRLAPDANDPARFTLKLTVTLVPVSWRVFGDNRGDAEQGPEQMLAAVSWNALFGANDRLITQLFTAPADKRELFFADLGYGHGWLGGSLWTEMGVSVSRSSDSASFPDYASESERRYGRLIVPVIRSREQSLWAKLQLDTRDTELVDYTGATTHEQTAVLRGSLSYSLTKGTTRADIALDVAHGIDALGASQNGDPNLSRTDARPQFTKARMDVMVTQNLLKRLDIVAIGSGQWADGPLVASEEFGVGGARYGRAYDYSEIVGDRAIAGAVEVRWTWKKLNDWLNSVQLYAFADAARIWNDNGAAFDEESLASAGGGLRISVAPGITTTVEVAKPLSRDVASQGDRTPRVFVSLSAGW